MINSLLRFNKMEQKGKCSKHVLKSTNVLFKARLKTEMQIGDDSDMTSKEHKS